MDETLFTVLETNFTLRQTLSFVALALFIFSIWRIVIDGILPLYFERGNASATWQRRIRAATGRIFLGLLVIGLLRSFGIDRILYTIETYHIRISSIFFALIVIEVARILDWLTSKVLIHQYYVHRDDQVDRKISDDSEALASKTVQYMVYTLAVMVLLSVFNLNVELFVLPIKDQPLPIKVSSIFVIILIFLLARLVSWTVTQLLLYSYYRRSDMDPGRRYAINQLINYIVYVAAIFVTIDNVGIELTVLWGGIAALLVGVGLGLQDVFRDLVSGIILLSDRTIKIHDVVDVNGQIGEVHKIGLRTSLVLARDETILMVPNSQLVSNQVTNWTHQNRRVRFTINIGVAYGTDPALVKEILLGCAEANNRILKSPKPFVRFTDFGDSALIFQLMFWTHSLLTIEDVKSELRFAVSQAFKDHDITIPFPQRDVWMKSSNAD